MPKHKHADTAQRTTAFLSDEGNVSPAQRGSRISAALATSVFGNVNLGYGLTFSCTF